MRSFEVLERRGLCIELIAQNDHYIARF